MGIADYLAPPDLRLVGACESIADTTRRNLRGLITDGLPDGALCYVKSLKNWFQVDRGDTQADDGITVVSAGAAAGMGNWIRLPSDWAGASPWLSQTTWYIDAVGGSDSNDGSTAATALASHAEFMRRLGKDPLITQAYTIHIVSDLSEYVRIRAHFRGAGAVLYYVGASAATLLAGTVATWTDSAISVEGAMTDVAGTDFSAAGVINHRLRLTSGAQLGRCTFISDYGTAGVNTARLGKVCYMAVPYYSFTTGGTPAPGDTFVVESQYRISELSLEVQVTAVGDAELTLRSTVVFENLRVGVVDCQYSGNLAGPTFLWCGLEGPYRGGAGRFVGCSIVDSASGLSEICEFVDTIVEFGGHAGGIPWFYQCGVYYIWGKSYFDKQGAVKYQYGTRSWLTGEYGVYDSNASGIVVDHSSYAYLTANWGANISGGRGVSCDGRVRYSTKPTITGAGGDASVGGTVRTWAQIPYAETTAKLAVIGT